MDASSSMIVDESDSVSDIDTGENDRNDTLQQNLSSQRPGLERSIIIPCQPFAIFFNNIRRGNKRAKAATGNIEELSFHQKAAKGDITKKDILRETDINKFDENGLTPLMWASAYGQYHVVAALLRSSAEIDLENHLGQTALLFASFGGHHKVVGILLLKGADVNHKDLNGNCAVIYAAYGNNPHTVQKLLSKKANFLAINENGDTAYTIAVKNKNYLVQQVIENHWVSLLTGD